MGPWPSGPRERRCRRVPPTSALRFGTPAQRALLGGALPRWVAPPGWGATSEQEGSCSPEISPRPGLGSKVKGRRPRLTAQADGDRRGRPIEPYLGRPKTPGPLDTPRPGRRVEGGRLRRKATGGQRWGPAPKPPVVTAPRNGTARRQGRTKIQYGAKRVAPLGWQRGGGRGGWGVATAKDLACELGVKYAERAMDANSAMTGSAAGDPVATNCGPASACYLLLPLPWRDT